LYDVSTGKLTDLTADHSPADENGALVQGVIGDSEDGTSLYFVAQGVLAAGATGGDDNLYLMHHDGNAWTTSFIAALGAGDSPDWAVEPISQTARVSPNGRFVAFMSRESLTGYDNTDAISNQPDAEVYLYDASTRRLTCTSCNPTGARPAGEDDAEGLPMDPVVAWREAWLAAAVPGWTPTSVNTGDYQSRYLSDEGRLFFDSAEALVPQDVNGREDVYEYEPDGIGSCTLADGCVYLISGGTSSSDSVFLDASVGGGDVFFHTQAQLVTQDTDHAFDIYDAHVCSTAVPCFAAPPVAPPACTNVDECKPAPTPQPMLFGAPASATFVGLGNPVQPTAKLAGSSRSKPKIKASKRPRAKTKKRNAKKRKAKRTGRRSGARRAGAHTSSPSWARGIESGRGE
jgi:hypothetical protein